MDTGIIVILCVGGFGWEIVFIKMRTAERVLFGNVSGLKHL